MRATTVTLGDGETVACIDTGGEGPVVLFVPGWCMTKEIFEHQARHALESGRYRFVSFDPRGQGESSKGFRGHHYDRHGADIRDVLDALELDRVVLGGWSAATMSTLSYVRQFGSDRLAGFVVIDGTPRSRGNPATEWAWYDGRADDPTLSSVTRLLVRDRAASDAIFVDWMLEAPTEATRQRLRELGARTPDAIAALLIWEGWSHRDESDTLVSLEGRVPLLYTVREEWSAIVGDWARRWTPSASFAAFGSHLMFWEQPDRFNAVLDAFLASSAA